MKSSEMQHFCPNCNATLPISLIKSIIGRGLQSQRKKAVGPPKNLQPCKNACGYIGGALERRQHAPKCPRKPVHGNTSAAIKR
jgi:hypothetical protein